MTPLDRSHYVILYFVVEFNLYAERIIRKVDEENIEEDSEGELVIGGRRLTNLRYADDTTLLASTQENANKIFKDLILESAQYNMQINVKTRKPCCRRETARCRCKF